MTYFRRHHWGARSVSPGVRLDPNKVRGIALHWPGDTVKRTKPDQVMAALRAWQSQHVDGNGWRDVAYQEAVDQAGNVYRLRGLRFESAANGSTSSNDQYGAVLLVLAIGEAPSAAMVAAVRRRVARHRVLFPRSREIRPHSDIRPEPTDCPGDKVRALIRAGAFDPES